MDKTFDLTGKKIFITGASSGIGKQIAIKCSFYGAQLYITGRNPDKLNDTKNKLKSTGHKAIPAELTDFSKIEYLVDKLSELDGAVFSAARGLPIPAKFIKKQHIDTIFNLNYNSIVLLISLLLKKQKIKNCASIVFLSSSVTKYPFFGSSLYASTKAAIEAYCKTLAIELAPKKIRCNCISPGFIDSPMLSKSEKQMIKNAMHKHQLAHLFGMGEVEDVANAALFLLSPASKWITGLNMILGSAC